MTNKKLFIFLAVFILVVLGLLVTVFKTRVSFSGKATGENTPSLKQSYLFASPLLARPGEKVRVSAFLLNQQGRGVESKPVMVTSEPPLDIEPVRSQTDQYGEAVFETASNTPGQFVVSASYNGQPFPQTVTLTFK